MQLRPGHCEQPSADDEVKLRSRTARQFALSVMVRVLLLSNPSSVLTRLLSFLHPGTRLPDTSRYSRRSAVSPQDSRFTQYLHQNLNYNLLEDVMEKLPDDGSFVVGTPGTISSFSCLLYAMCLFIPLNQHIISTEIEVPREHQPLTAEEREDSGFRRLVKCKRFRALLTAFLPSKRLMQTVWAFSSDRSSDFDPEGEIKWTDLGLDSFRVDPDRH